MRDVLDLDRGASMIALVTLAMALAPAFAPVVGSAVDQWLGWRAIFVGLALLGAGLATSVFLWLHETNDRRLPRLDLASIVRHYGELLRTPVVLGYAASTAAMVSAYFAFLAGMPYVLVEIQGRSIDAFGFYFLLIVAGYMLGNLIANRLSVRLGGDRMMTIGIGLSLTAMAVMLLLDRIGLNHPLALFVPMAFHVVGNGISQPNGISAAVGIRPDISGAAAGMTGFLQTITSAAAAFLVGHLVQQSALPMVLVMVSGVALSAVFFAVALASKR